MAVVVITPVAEVEAASWNEDGHIESCDGDSDGRLAGGLGDVRRHATPVTGANYPTPLSKNSSRLPIIAEFRLL